MLTVTESARQELKETLEANNADPETGLRLVSHEPGNFTLVLDTKTKDDLVVEHEESTVLLVDNELLKAIDGLTIDCQDEPDGRRLVMF